MDTRKGGHSYCPNCKQIVETRVLLEEYEGFWPPDLALFTLTMYPIF